MVPIVQEVVVKDVQAAHNEATKLAQAHVLADVKPVVHGIEHIDDINTEEL